MNFLSGQDELLERAQDDFFQTGNQPISLRHLSQPYNKYRYTCLFLEDLLVALPEKYNIYCS